MKDEPMDLIVRLEKATGPDRQLDRLIGEAVGGTMHNIGDAVGLGYARYTASIDAALTVVPEGWTRAVDATAPEMGIDVTLFPPDDTAEIVGTHANEATATCIAALKARHEGGNP